MYLFPRNRKSRIAKPDGHVLHSNEFAEYEKIIIKKMIKSWQPKGFVSTNSSFVWKLSSILNFENYPSGPEDIRSHKGLCIFGWMTIFIISIKNHLFGSSVLVSSFSPNRLPPSHKSSFFNRSIQLAVPWWQSENFIEV